MKFKSSFFIKISVIKQMFGSFDGAVSLLEGDEITLIQFFQ